MKRFRSADHLTRRSFKKSLDGFFAKDIKCLDHRFYESLFRFQKMAGNFRNSGKNVTEFQTSHQN